MSFHRNTDGTWHLLKPIKKAHPAYQRMVEKCLSSIDTLFCRAKDKCEFEFILTLLRVRGLQDAGWDPFDTLNDVFQVFNKAKKTFRNKNEITHFALFTYGIILEASEPYEILANLINVCEGDHFLHTNFPDYPDQTTGKMRSQSPADKIAQLKSRANRIKADLTFFDDFFDNKLRNAVFHSDYSIYWPNIRTINPPNQYDHDKWLELLNGALAYYEALDKIYSLHISFYDKPSVVDVHPSFSSSTGKKAITIIRKSHGLIGIKDNWTREELSNCQIPFRLGRFLPYEVKMIEQGQIILPPNRIERLNRFLRLFPLLIRVPLIKRLSPYFINRQL